MRWTRSSIITAIILFCITLIHSVVAVFIAQDLTSPLMRLVYMLGSIGLVGLVAMCTRARTCFYSLIALMFFGTIELVHLVINHATTSILFVYTILASEGGEFLELLSTGWPVVATWLLVVGIYVFLVRRFIPADKYFFSRRTRHIVAWTIGGLFAFAGLMLIVDSRTNQKGNVPLNAEDTRTSAWVGVEKICPINQALALSHIASLRWQINSQDKRLENFKFDATNQSQSTDPLIVLIIGETTRADHFSFNGYDRQTSPRLQKRIDDSTMVSFSKIYTVADLTTVSVPYMLSPATPLNAADYINTKSIVEAFSEAGYQTAWIADQSFGNPMLLRIANSCDYSYYQSAQDFEYSDEALIPLLTDYLANRPQFIVLHSLGCHFRYDQRYTERFRTFTPDISGITIQSLFQTVDSLRQANTTPTDQSTTNLALATLQSRIVNSYDNAILHTDFFVDSVIQVVESTGREAAVIYLADHGENLLDDGRMMFLHGSYGGSEYEFHVPLLVWLSDSYKQHYETKQTALMRNQNSLKSSMTLFHTLLDAGNISTPWYDPTHSVFSDKCEADSVIYGLDANLNCTILPYR